MMKDINDKVLIWHCQINYINGLKNVVWDIERWRSKIGDRTHDVKVVSQNGH